MPGLKRRTIAGAALAALPLSAAVAFGALSTISYEAARVQLDALSQDGNVDWLDHTHVRGLRVAALLIAGSSLALFLGRRSAAAKLRSLLVSSLDFARESSQALRRQLRETDRSHLVAVGLIVLVGFALRLWFLTQPIRCDEALTYIMFAGKPLLVTLSDYSMPNNHIFHSLLVKASSQVFGSSPWALRVPVFIVGVLTIPACYVAIRLLYGASAALAAAGLVATSSPLILYSTNARGHGFLVFFFMILLTLAKTLKSRSHPGGWVGFVIIAVLGAYSVPTFLYPFGVVVTWLALSSLAGDTRARPRIFLGHLAIATAAVGSLTFLLYVPVIFVTGLDPLISNEYVRPLPWPAFLESLAPHGRAVWSEWNLGVPAVVSWALAIGFVMGVARHRRVACDKVPLVAAAALWCIALLAASRRDPFVRVWLFLVPVYLGIACAGLSQLFGSFGEALAGSSSRGPLRPAVAALLASAWVSASIVASNSVYLSNETGTLREGRDITAYLSEMLGPRDHVLTRVPSTQVLTYHFHLANLSQSYLGVDVGASEHVFAVVNRGEGGTLPELLKRADLTDERIRNVRLARQFATASVYELALEPAQRDSRSVDALLGKAERGSGTRRNGGLRSLQEPSFVVQRVRNAPGQG